MSERPLPGNLRRVAVNGVNLAVDVRGNGPAILFIHGYPFDHAIWEHVVASLDGWMRIAPDLRGMGQSDAPDLGYSMSTYAEDLLALLNTLGVDRAVLCGLSMGGYIAFEMLRLARERVRGLILMDTRAEADSPEGRKARDAAAAQAREGGSEAIADAMLPKLLSARSRSEKPQLPDRIHKMMAGTPVAGILGAIGAMRDRPDSFPLLPTLTGLPALVMVGDDDELIPIDRAQAMVEALPSATLSIVAGAGHIPPMERPEVTTALISKFLATLPRLG
jgi:pimeloyl-ACP methyl ester carboxylesterase